MIYGRFAYAKPQSEPYHELEVHLKRKPAREAGEFSLSRFPDRRKEIDDQLTLSLKISNHLGLFKMVEVYQHNGNITA